MLDAAIPLSVSVPTPQSQTEQMGQALTLKNAQQKTEMGGLELDAAKKSAVSDEKIKSIFQSPDAFTQDENGNRTISPAAINKVFAIDPNKGMALQAKHMEDVNALLKMKHTVKQMEMQDLEHADKVNKLGGDAALASRQAGLDYLKDAPGDNAGATEIAKKAWANQLPGLVKSGAITQEKADESLKNFSLPTVSAMAMASGHYTQTIAEERKAREDKAKDLREERRADQQDRRLDISERRMSAALAGLSGDGKPPAGYRKTKDGNLEFIPGGPADPVTKDGKLGNRESVFINRVMLSANEAAKDLENVVKMPLTASTGWFGGRKQEGGLMAATKEVLANKMTGQEAQSYNVRSAGFQRSLAAIESAGLSPSGTLSHQMDAVIFKEGDTNKTKLEKLAQTRQIVEAGLETTMSNPKVPEAQRKHMEDVISSVRKAVPFTISDLDRLEAAQQKNPNATLESVMKDMKKKDKSVSSGDQALIDKYK